MPNKKATVDAKRSGKDSVIRGSLLIPLLAVTLCSCGRRSAQFFVFPENRRVFHDRNLIHEVFSEWDTDVSIMSPQGDYWYNECEYCFDWNYYLTLYHVYRDDSACLTNVVVVGWKPLYIPATSYRITVDSVRLTLLPSGDQTLLLVDSQKVEETARYYMYGIRYAFQRFRIPSDVDSLRIQFTAELLDGTGELKSVSKIDRLLYRWIKPKE